MPDQQYEDRTIKVNRVAKVVKGGRRFSFAALMVIGDGQGNVGLGYGKAKEAGLAVQKGIEEAKKNLFKVPLAGTTITHPVLGEAGDPGAPAAELLLTAHRELEKLVLTGKQARIKESVAQPYGDLVHEGQHLDPVCRDIEALLVSSQARVTGDVSVLLRPGAVFIEGVNSAHSLMAASKGVYGEAAGEWTPADALGYSKMLALTGIFYQRAGGARGAQP